MDYHSAKDQYGEYEWALQEAQKIRVPIQRYLLEVFHSFSKSEYTTGKNLYHYGYFWPHESVEHLDDISFGDGSVRLEWECSEPDGTTDEHYCLIPNEYFVEGEAYLARKHEEELKARKEQAAKNSLLTQEKEREARRMKYEELRKEFEV